ncbi:MAG: hypothetical protein JSV16_04030 [Candidatus Hydrogenedentota bacterium]|nr:MAG: hypothetical protein JSV16_04030 [Candidatus Hydrogenedentota bacterium]
MPESARETVESMSDVESVRFLTHFAREMFKQTDRFAILNSVSGDVAALEEIRRVRSLDDSERKARFGPQDSARMARRILEVLADDEVMAPVVEEVWETYRPDELFVETILSAGLVAGLLLFVATTDLEGEVMGIRFRKGRASAEQIRAIAEPFFESLTKLKGR